MVVEDDLPDELTPTGLFALRLRELRRRRDWSAQKLAARIAELDPGSKLTRGTLAKIESGKRGVWLDEVPLIAAALGVSPTMLTLPRPDDPWDVRLGGEVAVSSHAAWRWMERSEPLPGETPGGRRFFVMVNADMNAVEMMRAHLDRVQFLEDLLWGLEHEDEDEDDEGRDQLIASAQQQLNEARTETPHVMKTYRMLRGEDEAREQVRKSTQRSIETIARDLGVDPDEVE